MKFSWGSASLGAVVGAGLTVAILVPTSPEDEPARAAQPASSPTTPTKTAETTTAAPQRSPTAEPAGTRPSGSPLAKELSNRLEDAYRQEALPEIIGAEAGAEAADQVFDYVVAADDTDVVEELLGDFLERSPEELGVPGFTMRTAMDCSSPPCVARVELVPPGGDATSCGPAVTTLKGLLEDALQPGGLQIEAGGCLIKLAALSADAQARQQEINEGIEEFIEHYFAPAKERMNGLEAE